MRAVFAFAAVCATVATVRPVQAQTCKTGSCPAVSLVVSNVTTPESAGNVSSVRVEARTAVGVTSTVYVGRIHFTSSDASAVLPADYTFTSADKGVHTFTNGVTLKTAGTQSVTATDTANSTITGSQTGIVVNPAGVANFLVTGIPSPQSANAPASITVTARDAYGNRVTTFTAKVHFTSSDAQAVLPADYTFTSADAGSHTFVNGVTLKTVGTQSVTATTPTAAFLITGTESGIVVVNPAAATLVVSGIASPQTAGTVSSVSVDARDASGNRATGYMGTIHFTSTDPQASLPADYTFTSGTSCSPSPCDNGIHTFFVTLKTAATQSVSAADVAKPSVAGTQAGIVVNPGPATLLVVSGIPSPIVAAIQFTASVVAHDAYGNLASGYAGTVHFTSSDARAMLPSDYTFTTGTSCLPNPCDNGTHSFTGSFKTAGTQSVTATDSVAPAITGSQSNISVRSGPAATLSVYGFPSTTIAGTTGTFVVEAKDQSGNRAVDYAGNVRFTSSDPQATVPGTTSFAGSGGIATLTATLRTAGAQSIVAGDVDSPTIGGEQDGIGVSPASAARLSIGGTSSAVAGQSVQVAVTAIDPYGNVDTNYTGTVHFSSSDTQATLPADRMFTPGDFGSATLSRIVFRTAGTQTLAVADTQVPSIAGTESVGVAPAPAAALLVAGLTSPRTAGDAGTLTVTALDAFGNVAGAYAGTVAFTSSDANASLPGPTAFTSADAGMRTFAVTFRTAGTQSVTATDTVNASLTGTQANVTVVNGAAATLVVSGIPASVATGALSSVTVEVRDASGNRAVDYAGTIAFSSSDPVATLPAAYAFQASDSGLHTFASAVQFRTVGTQSVTASDSANGSITGTQSGISVTDADPPTWPLGSVLTATATSTTTAHLAWTAATDPSGIGAYRIYENGTLLQAVDGATLAVDVGGLTLGLVTRFQVQAGDTAGNWTTNGPTATVVTVPPDPATVAPPVDSTVPTTLADSTSFLYTGPNAIQTGVAPGTIQPKTVSVLRGTVHDRSGSAIPGVIATVVGHPEFGQTLTRADGQFDMAVNGGGPMVIAFNRDGYLQAQRRLEPIWQEYTQVPDVVLVPLDQMVTLVDMTNVTFTQAARGSVTIDELGARQATVLFPPGTQATLLMGDGSTQAVSTLHVHATEYTIGANGLKAMPATLPPTSVYTYALEFSADEAIAAGAKTVQFSQTVYGYVENFLAFPVGAGVPNGYYDRELGSWIPLDNGRVIQILGVTNGLADVDTNGDGLADDDATLAALNLSASERERLAVLYAPGQSVWRMPMQHFSIGDWNCPGGAPPGAVPPDPQTPGAATPPGETCQANGSIIECQTQVLGERVDVVGTPYSLNYRSSVQRGRRASYRLDVPLPAATGITLPQGVTCYSAPGRSPPCQIDAARTVPVFSRAYARIAGRQYQSLDNGGPPTTWKFEWNGLDAYGRRLQGEQPITVRTCMVYPYVIYLDEGLQARAFAELSATGAIISSRSNGPGFDIELCREWKGKLGGWDEFLRGLGGWTLSAQHVFDTKNKTIYRGDGERSSATDVSRMVDNVVIGNGAYETAANFMTDGAVATQVGLRSAGPGLAIAPDGTVFFNSDQTVWKLTTDGRVHDVIGSYGTQGLRTPLISLPVLALAPDGTLYVFDSGNGSFAHLYKLPPGGTLTAVLTIPTPYVVNGMAVGPDGSVYFSDTYNGRIRKLRGDGSVITVAGVDGTTGGHTGDGGPATKAQVDYPYGIAFAPDGTLYIAEEQKNYIRAVSPDGTIRTVAGTGDPSYYGSSGDGGPATSARIPQPSALAVSGDGTLYISTFGAVIRRVTPDGIIQTAVAPGPVGSQCAMLAKDCPATRMASFGSFSALAFASDTSLYAASGSSSYHRFTPGFTAAETLTERYVASDDGSEIYVFDFAGRHLRTLDGLTTTVLQRFGYDASGRLITIADRDNTVTTIQRDGQGNPTAIVSPYGQQTTLTLDGNGYLASISNPNSETIGLAYYPPVAADANTGGLLSQLTDARTGIHQFEFDHDGFLTKDTPPDAAFETLDRHGSVTPGNVTRSTALGRTTTYNVTWSKPIADTETSVVKDPAALSTTTVTRADSSTTTTYPDGTVVTRMALPDPRFGMDAKVQTVTTKLPSTLTRTVSETRTATMASPQDPLTLQSFVQQVTLNGKAYKSTYDSVAKTITMTTPVGRRTVATLDAQGRIAQVQPPGVLATSIQYDSRGRPQTVTQGDRSYSYTYDPSGRVATATDPLHMLSFGYDNANRPTSTTLPDLNVIGAGFDPGGNLTSLTPPGRNAHAFAYQAGDLESDYTPPAVDSTGSGHVHSDYDLDRAISRIAPDGIVPTIPTYDSMNGRLTSAAFAGGTASFGYNATSGQLQSIVTGDGNSISYAYDGALLKTTSFSGTVPGTIARTYDADFRLSSESVNGGTPVSFTYDNDGLLTGAGAMTISRDPTTGFVTGSTLGSINESHTYTAFGEEKTYTVSSGGTTLYSVDYGTRDQLGSIVTKTETVLGETHTFVYGYDSRNRLSDVTKDGVPIAHYDYDANGNRLTAPGLTASPVYDAQDRLTAYGACTYSYKPDGSLQTKTCPDGTTTYDYDSFGNLRNVVLPDGTHIEYLIDGQNRRVGKKVCGTTINVSCPVASLVEGFVYRSQFQPSAWLNGDGSVRATFVYGLKINVPEYMVHGSATYRLVTDHIGSVRLVIDMATGAVVERIDSDEFGNVLTDSAPGTQPFGFAGGLYDRDDALVRLGARDYGPSIGRWTSKDPILFNGGSASVYVYVRNDPLNFSDPTGLCFGETFNATFAFNLNTMNHLAFSFPTGVTRFGLGFLTAGATARTFGTVTLGQAIRSVFSPGLGPPGIATLGRIEGTIGSLALNTTLNSIAVAGALEIGFVIGSAADALGQALADGEPCRNGCK